MTRWITLLCPCGSENGPNKMCRNGITVQVDDSDSAPSMQEQLQNVRARLAQHVFTLHTNDDWAEAVELVDGQRPSVWGSAASTTRRDRSRSPMARSSGGSATTDRLNPVTMQLLAGLRVQSLSLQILEELHRAIRKEIDSRWGSES